jgi:hypothetical protein
MSTATVTNATKRVFAGGGPINSVPIASTGTGEGHWEHVYGSRKPAQWWVFSDRKTYNPRRSGKSSDVVTIWRSRQLCCSSSAAQSESHDCCPFWLLRRSLRTRNMAYGKDKECCGDMLIPRSRQGDRLAITRSLDPAPVAIGRFSQDAARSF